jgi:hypothetical protein
MKNLECWMNFFFVRLELIGNLDWKSCGLVGVMRWKVILNGKKMRTINVVNIKWNEQNMDDRIEVWMKGRHWKPDSWIEIYKRYISQKVKQKYHFVKHVVWLDESEILKSLEYLVEQDYILFKNRQIITKNIKH